MFRKGRGPTVIGAEVRIDGNIRSRGALEIYGEVQGDIEHEGRLFIGPGALCLSSIQATHLSIAGEVRGNARVQGKLEIRATGRLYGDVCCESLNVHTGGVLEGVNHMTDQGALARPVPEDQPPARAERPPAPVERLLPPVARPMPPVEQAPAAASAPSRLTPDHPLMQPLDDPGIRAFQGYFATIGLKAEPVRKA